MNTPLGVPQIERGAKRPILCFVASRRISLTEYVVALADVVVADAGEANGKKNMKDHVPDEILLYEVEIAAGRDLYEPENSGHDTKEHENDHVAHGLLHEDLELRDDVVMRRRHL